MKAFLFVVLWLAALGCVCDILFLWGASGGGLLDQAGALLGLAALPVLMILSLVALAAIAILDRLDELAPAVTPPGFRPPAD